MKKTCKCSVVVKTQSGQCRAEADSLDELLIAINAASAALAEGSPDLKLDAYARHVQRMYHEHKKSVRWSAPIAKASLELDLIKHYLQGHTLADAVEWCRTERQFKTSLSAVSRFWRRLKSLPISARVSVKPAR